MSRELPGKTIEIDHYVDRTYSQIFDTAKNTDYAIVIARERIGYADEAELIEESREVHDIPATSETDCGKPAAVSIKVSEVVGDVGQTVDIGSDLYNAGMLPKESKDLKLAHILYLIKVANEAVIDHNCAYRKSLWLCEQDMAGLNDTYVTDQAAIESQYVTDIDSLNADHDLAIAALDLQLSTKIITESEHEKQVVIAENLLNAQIAGLDEHRDYDLKQLSDSHKQSIALVEEAHQEAIKDLLKTEG